MLSRCSILCTLCTLDTKKKPTSVPHTRTTTVAGFLFICFCFAFLAVLLVERNQSSQNYSEGYYSAMEKVVFIEIPKTGAEEVMGPLFQSMASKNGFGIFKYKSRSSSSNDDEENKKEQMTFAIEEDSIPAPSLIYGQIAYMNLSQILSDSPEPAYVSLITDPVTTFKGHFYGRRGGNIGKANFDNLSSNLTFEQWKKKNLSECIMMEDPECVLKPGQNLSTPIRYFCGYNSYCRLFSDERAVLQAKQNIQDHFAVVGLLDELEATLVIMERKMPKFFAGIFNEFHSSAPNYHADLRPLTPEAKAKLELMLSTEYEFYYWVKERHLRQKLKFKGD